MTEPLAGEYEVKTLHERQVKYSNAFLAYARAICSSHFARISLQAYRSLECIVYLECLREFRIFNQQFIHNNFIRSYSQTEQSYSKYLHIAKNVEIPTNLIKPHVRSHIASHSCIYNNVDISPYSECVQCSNHFLCDVDYSI